MKTSHGVLQGYVGVSAVDKKRQIIISAEAFGQCQEHDLLEPIVALELENDDKLVSNTINNLGISVVALPGYAGDARIAGLRNDGSVYQDDDYRWADSPDDAITRVLADRLRAHANTTVLIEPWPRDYKPEARVEVVFDRLLREPLGGVDMAGQILLLSGDGRKLLEALPFQLVHYGRSLDKAVFFTATAQGIDDIARMAVRILSDNE